MPRTSRLVYEAFLRDHYRYGCRDHQSTYAHNVRISHLNIPHDLQDAAWKAITDEGLSDYLHESVLNYFAEQYNWRYQIGFSGRSGGYLVLLTGGRRSSEHLSFCPQCGQRNFRRVEDSDDHSKSQCGRCGRGPRHNYVKPPTFPYTDGSGMDTDQDYERWPWTELHQRVKLVKHFDQTVADAREAFLEFCRDLPEKDDE